MSTYREIFNEIEQRMYADHAKRHAGPDPRVRLLATAMLQAKAGASGPFDSEEQMHRTMLMAEWVIARLPFNGLALVEHADGLTEEQRQTEYRNWLRRGDTTR